MKLSRVFWRLETSFFVVWLIAFSFVGFGKISENSSVLEVIQLNERAGIWIVILAGIVSIIAMIRSMNRENELLEMQVESMKTYTETIEGLYEDIRYYNVHACQDTKINFLSYELLS